MVIWFQGCSRGCPGCFNPLTHDRDSGFLVPVDELVRRIQEAESSIEGITMSGGEPLEQPQQLHRLLEDVRRTTDLSVVLYSGYTFEEIPGVPFGKNILDHVDVLIAGPFVESRRTGFGLLGSSNQRVHFLTDRYSSIHIKDIPDSEIRIESGGMISISGLDPPSFSGKGSLPTSPRDGNFIEGSGGTIPPGEYP
jgi:anaerobic ribonucleoside-triphosphate reductase activating protein